MNYAKTLPGRILNILDAPRWGGGLHRDHLAWLLGRQPSDTELKKALWALYGMKRIDFVRNYIVITTRKG